MLSLLDKIALASVAFSGLVSSIPTPSNSTLETREVESSENPNLQINVYPGMDCTGPFALIDTKYNDKEQIPNTGSYYLTRDLSPGENITFTTNNQCLSQPVDISSHPGITSGDKRGCFRFQASNVQCYQLTFTAPAPSAPSPNAVADTCDYNFKAVMDGFIIRGKNFDRTKMKADGSGLRDQIARCGALTSFQFLMTPQDPVMQWTATGNMPAGLHSCIGNAVVNAGGKDKGHC